MNKSSLSTILDKYNFIFDKSEKFFEYDEDFLYCESLNKEVSIVIKQYETFDRELILADVVKARSILRENNINIWNSYYLILFRDKVFWEKSLKKIYALERDSRGLRKYIILSEEDIYRMPFIKRFNPNDVSLDFETNFHQLLDTEEGDINNILRWIMESDGDLVDIKKQTIKEKISEVSFGGDFDEIK